MKTTISVLFLLLFLAGCSTMSKVGAGAALPFAAITDTVVAPFQLIGDAGVGLVHLGDRHSQQVYAVNKKSVTLPLAEITTLVFYIPGYLLYPVDSITPDEYYPLTKKCVGVIEEEETKGKFKDRRIIKTRKIPKNDFEEW